MKRRLKTVKTIGIAIGMLSIAASAQAGYLQNIEYEYGLKYSAGQFKGHDAPNDSRLGFVSPLNAAVFFPGVKKNNFWTARVSFEGFSIEADEGKSDSVAQDVEELSFSFGYRTQQSFTRKVKLWFEAGIGDKLVDATNRHTIDENGFLVSELKDSDSNSIFAYASTTHYFNMTKYTDLGLGFELKYAPSLDELRYAGIIGIKF